MATVVIDVFRSRNNNRNVDKVFATLNADEAKDLDPVVQIYARRALQIRRTCCKNKAAEDRLKESLGKYAARHRSAKEWPRWYHDIDPTRIRWSNRTPLPTNTARIGMPRSIPRDRSDCS